MKKKSRLEILRGKIARQGIKVTIRDDMPEEVAASFIAEMTLCPDCAAAAAQNWEPGTPRMLSADFFAALGGADDEVN
jgi:hypothetical protein